MLKFVVLIGWIVLLEFFSIPLLAIVSGATFSLFYPVFDYSRFRNYGKYSLQGAIILIGFNLNAFNMWTLSKDYLPLIICLIALVLLVGFLLGKIFSVDKILSVFISCGTAICGGTTVVTLAPIIKARADQVAIALAMIFGLNMIALSLYPIIGHYLELTDLQFGLWSAISIHDTSSVVATGAAFSDQASEIAATIKLGRTLWLIPLAFAASLIFNKNEKSSIQIPMFIVLFIMASIVGTFLEQGSYVPAVFFSFVKQVSTALLILALFIIGTECSRETLAEIKVNFLSQSLLLWLLVSTSTLAFIYYFIN